jgi:hypothetical protein
MLFVLGSFLPRRKLTITHGYSHWLIAIRMVACPHGRASVSGLEFAPDQSEAEPLAGGPLLTKQA